MDITHILEAVKQAGKHAKNTFEQGIYKNSESACMDAREKSQNELVIKEDLICENIIISKIKEYNPNANIYSEESSDISQLKNDKKIEKNLTLA